MINVLIITSIIINYIVWLLAAIFGYKVLKRLKAIESKECTNLHIAQQAMADSLASAGHRNKLGKAVLKVIKPDHDD